MIVEICAANLASALAAQRAGAHRVELCSALELGGLTPSLGLVEAVVRELSIPVHVLIRPREGDFCYTGREIELMCRDIEVCRQAGAAGAVVGAMAGSTELDWPAMEKFRRAAKDMDLTCHRAFDFVGQPETALELLIGLGYQRVLSSGQAATAFEGRFLLKKLVGHADGRIAVMPGGGINEHNIGGLAAFTGAGEFHFSAKKKMQPPVLSQLPGLELWHWESDEAAIRTTIKTIEEHSAPWIH